MQSQSQNQNQEIVTKTCNKCKGAIQDKRLKQICRQCLDTRKEQKQEREDAIICAACKLYKTPCHYLQDSYLKTCKDCRTYKNTYNKSNKHTAAESKKEATTQQGGEMGEEMEQKTGT